MDFYKVDLSRQGIFLRPDIRLTEDIEMLLVSRMHIGSVHFLRFWYFLAILGYTGFHVTGYPVVVFDK